MTEWDALADFLKENGRDEWAAMVSERKVYVAFQGSDVDRRMVGVYSHRGDAEDKSCEHGHNRDDVEEAIVDDLLEWEIGDTYRAVIKLKSGEIISGPRSVDENRHPTRCVVDELRTNYYLHNPWVEVVSPISMDHAINVATEKRQEWLRSQPLTAASTATAPAELS